MLAASAERTDPACDRATVKTSSYHVVSRPSLEQLVQRVTSLFEQYVKLSQSLNYETTIAAVRGEDIGKFTDAVASNLSVSLPKGMTLQDNGTVSFASGDTVTLNGNVLGSTSLSVGNGGRLQANGTTFSDSNDAYSRVYLDNGNQLQTGDLTGNAFDLPFYVPAGGVQYLGNNLRFKVINILPGTQHDKIFRLKGLGSPSLRDNGTGDQLIRVKVEIPTKLTPKQKELLEEYAKSSGEPLDHEGGILNKMKNIFD